MKTTNLKQTSGVKPRKWFQFRDQPPSREAMASHRRSHLYLREFAKNSRILPCLGPAQIEPHNFFSLVNRVLRTPLAFGKLMQRLTKRVRQIYESVTWNIAGGWSGVSSDALDSNFARWTVRSNGNSKRGAFRFL